MPEPSLENMLKLYTKKDLWERIQQLKQQLAESERNNLILYSMLYETLEKQGSEDIASKIDQMTGLMLEKQADWFKGNRNYDQLKQQLAEKEKEETKRMEVFEKGCQEYYKSNQTIIAELEKVIEFAKTQDEFGFRKSGMEIFMFVDQQIKSLKGEK